MIFSERKVVLVRVCIYCFYDFLEEVVDVEKELEEEKKREIFLSDKKFIFGR